MIRFRFTRPAGFHGTHEFLVREHEGGSVLEHVLEMDASGWARVSWRLIFRPLHDALIEDALDRAERALTDNVRRPARWSPYVRALRRAIRASRRRVVASANARSRRT